MTGKKVVTNVIRNFIPSGEWLEIRWDTPGHTLRGNARPMYSEVERRELENESEAGIKRRHRRGFAIAFIHVLAKDALDEFFHGKEV